MADKSLTLLRAGSLACALCFSLPALAAEEPAGKKVRPTATERFEGQTISFEFSHPVRNVLINIAGPGGYRLRKLFASEHPNISLGEHGAVADGPYRYNLSAAMDWEPEEEEKTASEEAGQEGDEAKKTAQMQLRRNAPRKRKDGKPLGFRISGSFAVRDGEILDKSAEE